MVGVRVGGCRCGVGGCRCGVGGCRWVWGEVFKSEYSTYCIILNFPVDAMSVT